ncbi:cold-shock protein [Kitasatospora kazusensis]|uniref:Cold-shock protein n=1 Tax=Kitasatospora kazusensis TaxID=407974 RepID=A0ABN2ZVX7_9ACTN
MASGTVKVFHHDHGYGAITPDDGGAEVALYYDAVLGDHDAVLVEGRKVEYDLLEEEGRPVAERVRAL